jgi:hypothetical protein
MEQRSKRSIIPDWNVYFMNHCAFTYLINPDGKWELLCDFDKLHDTMRIVADIEQVLDNRADDKKEKTDCPHDADDFTPMKLWFRGVDSADYQLKPEAYRKRDDKLQKFPRVARFN